MANQTRAEVFGKNLEHIRKSKNISRKQLAEVLGIGVDSISLYEGGRRLPPFDKIYAAADFFGVSIIDLTGDTPAAEARKIFEHRMTRAADTAFLAGFYVTPLDDGSIGLVPPTKITCENGIFVSTTDTVFRFKSKDELWGLIDAAERFAIANDQPLRATILDFLDRHKTRV